MHVLYNQVNITSSDITDEIHADFERFIDAIVKTFSGTLDHGYLVGQTDGPEPNHDIGPWLRLGGWWWGFESAHNINKYLPFPMVSGVRDKITDLIIITRLWPLSHNNIALYLPGSDHSGQTLATTDDIGAKIPNSLNEIESDSGTSFNLNFDTNATKYIEPDSNFTVHAVGGRQTDHMDLWVKVRSGVAAQPTWPSDWIIGPGSMPVASVSSYKFQRISIDKVGGKTFVTYKKTFTIGSGGTPASTVAPAIVSITSVNGSGIIDVLFDKLLKGGKVLATEFSATRNDLDNAVTSSFVSGKHAYIYVNNSYLSMDTGQITYGGSSSIKDIDGIPSGNFGPTDIVMISAGKIPTFSGKIGYSGAPAAV